LFVTVCRSPLHGHGCFTTREVPAGEVVARTRMLVFPPEETELLLRTGLKNYLFYLRSGPTSEGPFHSALAVGPISFCNHSAEPNCSFQLDEEGSEITLTARRALRQNEEITIDYGDYAAEIV
jgi:SET domain-containing protein